MFVFPLVTYAVTGSALLAGIAGGLELLGTAIALLPGGLLADRAHRGRVMRAASGVGVLLYASLVVAGVLGALTVPHLFVVGVLTGVCAGRVRTGRDVRGAGRRADRAAAHRAVSQQQARQHVASLVGGPLGGALFAVTRWMPFLFDAVTFAVSWVLLGRIRTDLSPVARPVDAGAAARADIAEGLRFQWERPFFRTIMVWGMCSNLVINALFMAATVRLIQGGFAPWSIGLVETAAGVCGVLGAVVAPRIIERTATGVLTVVVAWSFVPLLVPLIFWNNPVVVMVSLSTGVFLNPAGNAGIGSYKMSITPPELVGRVQSVGQFLGWSTMPLRPGARRRAARGARRPGGDGRAHRTVRAGRADPDAEPHRALGAAAGGVAAPRTRATAPEPEPRWCEGQTARIRRGRRSTGSRALAVDQLGDLAGRGRAVASRTRSMASNEPASSGSRSSRRSRWSWISSTCAEQRGERRTELVVDRLDEPLPQLLRAQRGLGRGRDVLDQRDRADVGAQVVAQRHRVAHEVHESPVGTAAGHQRVTDELAATGPDQRHLVDGERRLAVGAEQVEPLDEERLGDGFVLHVEELLQRRADEGQQAGPVAGDQTDAGVLQRQVQRHALQRVKGPE